MFLESYHIPLVVLNYPLLSYLHTLLKYLAALHRTLILTFVKTQKSILLQHEKWKSFTFFRSTLRSNGAPKRWSDQIKMVTGCNLVEVNEKVVHNFKYIFTIKSHEFSTRKYTRFCSIFDDMFMCFV